MSERRYVIPAAEITIAPGTLGHKLPLVAGGIGVAGIALSAILGTGDPQRFYFSWLVAFLFFLSIALGGLFFVLVLYATKAGWGVTVRRFAENAMGTLPLFAVLFVPVFLGRHELFHWTHADAVAHDPLLQAKEPYLNVGFFTARAIAYFALWIGIGTFFSRQSERQDGSGDHAITRRLQAASGPALIVFALTASFAAIDWMMSLDPHWYSTIFGVYFFAGTLVAIFSFLVLAFAAARAAGFLRTAVTTEHLHDLGKLLFAFTVFWAYIAFSQYFLIWYANIPEETVFYLHRLEGGWRTVSMLLLAGHFGLPFLFLMPRFVKRKTPLLVLGATWMLFMHLTDIYWCVMPNLQKHGFHPALLDVTTLVGVGGLFLAAFGWLARSRALIPVRDPRLPEALSFENV